MKVIMFDIDTLRADHMGCYGYGQGYHAGDGRRWRRRACALTGTTVPMRPALPSRASLVSGLYGIHNGIVGHGGTAADLRLQGESQGLYGSGVGERAVHAVSSGPDFPHGVLFQLCGAPLGLVVSTPAWMSAYNAGTPGRGVGGHGDAGMCWTGWKGTGRMEDWLLHVHYWDPHTPYRTPEGVKSRFQEYSLLPDDWITDEIFEEHLRHIGPHGANEINMWNDEYLQPLAEASRQLEDKGRCEAFYRPL